MSLSSLHTLCVFCGSSNDVLPPYIKVAIELGAYMAKNHIPMVYGGGDTGLMGTVARTCLEKGGHVTGVTIDALMTVEGSPPQLSELIIVSSMHERKKKMFDLSTAFVVLPGGLGTLDEAFELLTWRQIGLHNKPLIFLNSHDYWTPLLEILIPHMIREKFVRSTDQQLFLSTKCVTNVLSLIEREPHDNKNFVSKWG